MMTMRSQEPGTKAPTDRRGVNPRIIPTSTRWPSWPMSRPTHVSTTHIVNARRERSTGKYRTRDRIREDPEPGQEDSRVRHSHAGSPLHGPGDEIAGTVNRSEERRVGKEGR